MGQPTPASKRRGLSSIEQLAVAGERDQFLENFSLLITSGMGVLVALESLKADARSSTMRRVISDLHDDVDSGKSLSKAFEVSGLLPPEVVSLIRIGEEAGRLPENLKLISIQQQKERLFQSKLISAMIYPMLIFTVTILVGLVIAWFVLPRLSIVFGQLQIELPAITRAMISLGQFLGSYGAIAVPGTIVAILIMIYLVFLAPGTRIIGERLILALPGLRRIIVEVELARFGYIMGSLLNAGLPVLETLQSLANSTSVISYRRLYQHLKTSIEEGNSFRKSLDSFRDTRTLVPIPIQQLISAAEQSGSLSESFLKISSVYEEKTDVTTKNLVVVIEPMLLVTVWLGVVLVAVAVIMPIYKLVGDFNTSVTTTPTPPVEESIPVETEQSAEAAPISLDVRSGGAGAVLGITDPPAPTAALSTQMATVVMPSGQRLNIRQAPLATALVLATAADGDSFAISGVQGEWVGIVLDTGGEGWVHSQYVVRADR